MPIRARNLIRKMRGGAQAHLLEADNGRFYVVKFRNNPQHRRILINEWIGSVFLQHLQIATPAPSIVELTAPFLEANPGIHMQLGSRRVEVEPGWHYASQFPGDPRTAAVFDFLPDSLLPNCVNLHDYLGVLVFDKWTSNADSRQSIFYKARVREAGVGGGSFERGYVTQMMDNGFLFDGPNWQFGDSPIQGHYFRPFVYRNVRSLDSFQPWLERVRHFPIEVVDDARKALPPAWIEEDEQELDMMLERLVLRRERVGDLIEAAVRAKPAWFPNWEGR